MPPPPFILHNSHRIVHLECPRISNPVDFHGVDISHPTPYRRRLASAVMSRLLDMNQLWMRNGVGRLNELEIGKLGIGFEDEKFLPPI